MRDRNDNQELDIAREIIRTATGYLGAPFRDTPLIGAYNIQEVFVSDREAFDCVTFVETVLAQSLSTLLATQFKDELKALRYRNGEISWLSRLHYFSDWLTTNTARGVLEQVIPDLPVTHRTLSLLPHYPHTQAQLKFLPVTDLTKYQDLLRSGDILAFGSTRENLDVSHTGFLKLSGDSLPILIHATKSFGKVIEEPLNLFLKRFGDSPGLLVYRAKTPKNSSL